MRSVSPSHSFRHPGLAVVITLLLCLGMLVIARTQAPWSPEGWVWSVDLLLTTVAIFLIIAAVNQSRQLIIEANRQDFDRLSMNMQAMTEHVDCLRNMEFYRDLPDPSDQDNIQSSDHLRSSDLEPVSLETLQEPFQRLDGLLDRSFKSRYPVMPYADIEQAHAGRFIGFIPHTVDKFANVLSARLIITSESLVAFNNAANQIEASSPHILLTRRYIHSPE